MTEKQHRIYMLFCMAGRTEEALEYKAKCEKEASPGSSPDAAEDRRRDNEPQAGQSVSRADIHYLVGDATAPQVAGQKIIVHVCNDIGAWGCGFVMALSRRWAIPERRYRAWYHTGKGFGLGAVQFVPVELNIVIANMIAQRGLAMCSQAEPPIRYEALEQCLRQVAERAVETNASVHMPRIGCGLAGGDWAEVEPIIRRSLTDAGVPVYVYDLPPASH